MDFSFSPDYFQYSRVLYSDASVENCITLFCHLSDEKSDLFLYDSKLVHELLLLNPQCSDMEFLSIMFDFNGILNQTVDESQPFLALKKLTAIGFFLNQLLKQGIKTCINEIEKLFQIGKKLFSSKNPEIINISLLTYSTILLILSSKCRDLNNLSVDMDSFFNIARFVVDFFVNQKIVNQYTLPHVITFLLSSLYCFSPKMELNDKIHHLIVDIIKAISSFNQNVQIDFNYFSLLDKIFSFLEKDSVFPKKTKLFIFSFISVLILRKAELVNFLFDDVYLGKSVQFIKSIVNKVKSTFHPTPIKIYKKLPKKEMLPNMIISKNTFNDQFVIEEPKIEKSNTIQYVPFFPKNKDIKNILNSYIRICKATSSRFFELMSKTMFTILHSEEELSLPMHSFVVYCLNSMITEDTEKAIETFRPANLHLILQSEIYQAGFVKEISLNIANSLFYISQNCSTASFLPDVITKFVHDCKTLVIKEQYAINIIKCLMLCEEKAGIILMKINFGEIISNLMLDLRAYHLASQDEETIQAIVHSRKVLFEFIQMFLHLKSLKDLLISSDYFINALCQMMYEKNLVDYVISIFGRILVSSKSTDSQFHSIVIFIQSIFDRKVESGFIDISHRIINALIVQFHQNPSEMSILFFHTKLLDYLINFVLYTKEKEDLFSLFKLFQDFSKFQELAKEYILDMAPFMQLEPIIKSQVNSEDIKNWLWSFICGTECKYLDHVRPIKNALPLSLIYHSFREDKQSLLEYISFLQNCVDADQPSALEVCSGDIPSLLIEKIREYRQYESGDSLFTAVLKLLATLSHYSMKSNDLRSLFQTMTLINGQRRPFYTQDLLKLLQNIFGMKLEMPCAFISSSGKIPLFKVKETKLLNTFSDFSIFFEFKLKSDNWKPKSELLRIVTDDNTLLLWFRHNQLILTFLNKEEPLELVIDIKFPINIWIQIALVFSEGLLSFYMNSVLVVNAKVPKFVFKTKISACSFARSFACNLSCFIFTNCALDIKNIKNLYYFPKYLPTSFDVTEIGNFPRIFQPLFTGSISKSAIFIFNALVTHSRKLPNLAKSYVNCAAEFFGQAFTFSPQPKQILRCIGGIQTIYPLFSQLDQSICQDLLSDLLAFVTALFNNSMLNQEDFYYSNSFQIVASLLSSKISDYDDDFIDRIREMYEAIDMRLLLRQMFMDLLFNVRLWIYLPVEKQDKLYQAFIKLFNDSSSNTKKVIVTQLTFRHILMLIRVFLWSVNTNSNPELKSTQNDQNENNSSLNKSPQFNICLLDKPKIDHKSDKTELQRPKDLSIVRLNLLNLAELIEPIKFTVTDAETLIYYSLDTSDPELCADFLTLLTKLLQSKNQILFKILNQYFTYKDFFQLILSNNEKIRVNSFNIMMLFTREELRKLLDPYSTISWIDAIVRFINMKYTSAYFADVALSYAFGFYKKGNPIETYVEFSKNEKISDQVERISVDKVLPLVMLIISKLPEKLGKIYTLEINKSVTTKRTKIVAVKFWDHPFILYILSRLTVRKRSFGVIAPKINEDKSFHLKQQYRQHKNLNGGSKIIHADETTMDESGRDILLSLSFLYTDVCKIESVKYLLHVLSIMLKRDVYFVMESVLFAILNHSLLSGKYKEESLPNFIYSIFEYIFILPDIDSYASLSFENYQIDKCLSLPSNLGFSLNSEMNNDGGSSSLLSKKQSFKEKARYKSIYKYGSGDNLSSLSSEISDLSSTSASVSENPSASASDEKLSTINTSLDQQKEEQKPQNVNNNNNNNIFIMKRSFAREKYQDLYNIKMKCEKFPLKYFYSIRIDPITGTWVDEKLADLFCRLLTIYPSLANDEYILLLFAFTVSIGIQSQLTYSTFIQYSHTIKSYIPLKGHLTDLKGKILICYLAGMAKIFYNTTSTHDSHKILFEDLKVLNNSILDVLKINVPTNFSSFEEFDNFYNEKEKESETNVLLLAIERFSYDIEISFMNNLASQVSKSTTKDYYSFIDYRNPTVKPELLSTEINHQNSQIIMQLQRFASAMKNAQTKGLKRYIDAWRMLSSEKGPWCPPEKSFTHHWKLENSTQKIMRRGLMKENFAFTNHNEAAVLRDTSNRIENDLVGTIDTTNKNENEENYESIMKKLRITDFIGDKTVETLFQDNEISNINKIEGVQLQSDDIVIKVDAKLITMKDVNSGTFMLTSELLIFDSPSKSLDISLDVINFVFKRRYLVQDTSLEIYTSMHRSYFFEFVGDQRNQVIRELLRIKPKNLKFVQDTEGSIKKVIEVTQKRWQKGKMSNFDYLMAINMFAGRTYNDLGQYPIFPWVIADYTSDVLNLNDPTVYRDLTKPLGALTDERLRMLKERYEDGEGMDLPYLYGSFYSSSAVVIGYLVRVEPFTSLHIKLQSGKFDLPDRLFNSIPKAWESVTTAMMDFRELIPEFFYLPDILVNANNFDLGISISMAKSYNISTTSLNSKSCHENKGNRSSFVPYRSNSNENYKKISIKSLPHSKLNLCSSSSTNLIKSFHDKNKDLKSGIIRDWRQLNNSTTILNNTKSDANILLPEEHPINVNYCNNIKYCDVELPAWASSPLDFIRKNRAALESPIVSATLPYWIDMIFGITSRGEKAIQIDNVFHPFFFCDSLKEYDDDLVLKKEYAACFGQAPFQIFEKPHPTKLVVKKQIEIHDPQLILDCGKGKPILSIEADDFGFVTVINSDFNVVSNRDNKVRKLFCINSVISPEEIDICSKLVRTKGKIVISATPWDRSFNISNINEGLLFTKRFHISKISAVSITEHRYATASLDGTVALWKKPEIPVDPPLLTPKPSQVLSTAVSSSNMIPIVAASSTPILHHPISAISSSNLLSNLVPSASSSIATNIGGGNVQPSILNINANVNTSSSSSFNSVSISSSGNNSSGITNNNSVSTALSNNPSSVISSFENSMLQNLNLISSLTQNDGLTRFQEQQQIEPVVENEENRESKLNFVHTEFVQIPISTITKHNSPVSAVDINEMANIMVSGARDGTIITSSLMSGRMIKMIKITNTTEPLNYYNIDSIYGVDLDHSTSFANLANSDNENESNFNNLTLTNNKDINNYLPTDTDDYDYFDENDNKSDEIHRSSEILNEYSIADESIDDPNIIKVSNSGTICVCISRPANSIIKIYDINLNEISCCRFDSYIRCMTIFEWYNGREMLAVALRNKKIELIKIPSFKHVWTFNGFNTSFIEIAKNPIKSLLIGTMEGNVIKIDLEEYDESSGLDNLSNANGILGV